MLYASLHVDTSYNLSYLLLVQPMSLQWSVFSVDICGFVCITMDQKIFHPRFSFVMGSWHSHMCQYSCSL